MLAVAVELGLLRAAMVMIQVLMEVPLLEVAQAGEEMLMVMVIAVALVAAERNIMVLPLAVAQVTLLQLLQNKEVTALVAQMDKQEAVAVAVVLIQLTSLLIMAKHLEALEQQVLLPL